MCHRTLLTRIIVSAGASGCVVASRLAHSAAKPSVLLLEAGGSNQALSESSSDERFNLAFSPDSPYNWNFKTTPQHQLAGQTVDYSRGKGLGGSTAINFCGWTVGPRDDFDEYARLVKDDRFGWRNVSKCLRRIERLHPKIPDHRMRKYVDPKPEGIIICVHEHQNLLDNWYMQTTVTLE
jgi:choline dehydrogenase-like flavoprotein